MEHAHDKYNAVNPTAFADNHVLMKASKLKGTDTHVRAKGIQRNPITSNSFDCEPMMTRFVQSKL